MSKRFTPHEVQRRGRSIDTILRPDSAREALEMLRDHPSARPLAGGTDLILELQRDHEPDAPPVTLVDLTAIDGFRAITESENSIVLAGGVTHNQVVAQDSIARDALALAQACLEIGSPQLRNRATVAGNLVTASPANDSISALLALGATVELQRLSESGALRSRLVPVEEFFTGFRRTARAPDELITAIHVPRMNGGGQSLWVKLGLRRAQAISVVHAGFLIERDASGWVSRARLALGSVAPTVVLSREFSELLEGNELTDELVSTVAASVARSIDPITDLRGTDDYRRVTVEVIVRRSLETLRARQERTAWPDRPPILATVDALTASTPRSRTTIHAGDPVEAAVNGTTVSAPGAALTLLDWLRDRAGAHPDRPLSGVKEGCAEGECGACTVVLNGAAVMSCLVTAGQADGSTVVTIEGLADTDELHPLQDAFVEEFAVQCGFCIPGFIVAGARLLDEIDDPSDEQIKLALSGNLCRCTGYYPIIDATRLAAALAARP